MPEKNQVPSRPHATADRRAPAADFEPPPPHPQPAGERARSVAADIAHERVPGPTRSRRLRFVAGYFTLTGYLSLLAGVATLALLFVDLPTSPGQPPLPPWTFAVTLLRGVGLLWTGRLLARRRRAGGQMAIAMLAFPVLDLLPALARSPLIALYSLAFAVLGCALVASVWHELDDPD